MAEAARRLGLKHVVITSVTRDDLADGGADHFRRTVEAVRAATGATVEVLVPDFIGKEGALELLMQSRPDVFNHNTETVPRLYRTVRGRKSQYPWTLALLAAAKRIMPEVKTKSGLMLGLDLMADAASGRAYPWEEKRGTRACLAARGHGALLRQLGDTVVIMPPLCVSLEEIDLLAKAAEAGIRMATA